MRCDARRSRRGWARQRIVLGQKGRGEEGRRPRQAGWGQGSPACRARQWQRQRHDAWVGFSLPPPAAARARGRDVRPPTRTPLSVSRAPAVNAHFVMRWLGWPPMASFPPPLTAADGGRGRSGSCRSLLHRNSLFLTSIGGPGDFLGSSCHAHIPHTVCLTSTWNPLKCRQAGTRPEPERG